MTNEFTIPHGTGTGGAFGFVRDGYDRAEANSLTASDVESATVYGRDDESIESISALKVNTDGKITDAVIYLMGFLGMGAHSLLLPFSQLTVLRAKAGTDTRVHLDRKKDKLRAVPNHLG